ncbi:MAG: hypothetical protein ACOCZK_00945 [Planctomycetota bacterium]
MQGYHPRLDRVHAVQEAWLDELLTRTLPAGNVLYCMNNETSTDPAWGSGTPREGLARFWRDLLAGSAAARFHRPICGIGPSPLALHCLRSVRLVEQHLRFWDLRPADDLLVANDDRAYAARTTDGRAVVFLTQGTASERIQPTACRRTWIAPTVGAVVGETTLTAEDPLLRPPLTGPMVAVLVPA